MTADPSRARARSIVSVKVIHTAIFAVVEACVVYLLWAGIARRTDRRAAVAAVVVMTESAVYVANGFRCPLTEVAEAMGAESGSVTDIYLPRWFAKALPLIHVPILGAVLALHGRNLGAARLRRHSRPRGITA